MSNETTLEEVKRAANLTLKATAKRYDGLDVKLNSDNTRIENFNEVSDYLEEIIDDESRWQNIWKEEAKKHNLLQLRKEFLDE